MSGLMCAGAAAWRRKAGGEGVEEWLPVGFTQHTAHQSNWAAFGATTTNMRDSDYTTGAACAGVTALNYIRADLGVPRNVGKVVVAGGDLVNWGGVADYINGRAIQYSMDDSVWTAVASISGASDSAPFETEITFSPVTARYWRLTPAPNDDWLATTEFRLYPTGA